MLPPPNFPDVVHVANGCYISSLVYVGRFRSAYPAEQAATAALPLPNADGSLKLHTLAIVSWHGQWWARDEYYGLAELRSPSSRPWDEARAARRADAVFRARAVRMLAAGHAVREPDRVPAGAAAGPWRKAQVEAAQHLLPIPSEIVWLRANDQPLPFLFFHTSDQGSFAVYDPSIGTAQAVAAERNAVRLVAAVAGRLGYSAAAGFSALPARPSLDSAPGLGELAFHRPDALRPAG